MPSATLTPDLLAETAARAGLSDVSLVLARLDRPDDARVAIEPDRYLYPASMLKTPLALAAYTLVHDRELRLSDSFEVAQANMTATDMDSPLVPGYRSPLHELIELMITRSDNVATNMLYDIVGRQRGTDIVQGRYGLRATAFYRKLSGSLPLIHDADWDGVHRNAHSAGDAARLFELIARDLVPFAFALRQTLARQRWKNKLAAGLLPGDQFAHKTGDTDEVTHDGGILDTADGASYVLVVYTGMESNDTHNAMFAPFMQTLRQYL
jgi:beta-lactamase class A